MLLIPVQYLSLYVLLKLQPPIAYRVREVRVVRHGVRPELASGSFPRTSPKGSTTVK